MSVKEVPGITLYLTKKQKVFTKNVKYDRSVTLYNVAKQIIVNDRVMKLKSGKEISVFVTFDESCYPALGTIINEKVVFDIWN
jgi:hypothetical protein